MNSKRKKYKLSEGKTGAALAVLVVPGAQRNRIEQVLEDGIVRVSLTNPNQGWQANQSLVELLAETLDVPSAKIDVIAGQNSAEKLVSILGLDVEAVNERIMKKTQ
jgi:uncharacterized protein YggU (UPF0235/DUF167 family)